MRSDFSSSHFPTVAGKKPSSYRVYLVGGYVRDQLLGRTAHERDWVVVGATPELLLQAGYEPVGKAFPVFLHPKTHEEYALARTERKVTAGHTGFICISDPTITLEQDLQRRDLTINAIAMTETGELIDPYGGCQDLQVRILRHVSDAFAEDPLRVLRVARLRAQLAAFDFNIAPETVRLMKQISHSGELVALSAERIWGELKKALLSEHPVLFFETLTTCEAMASLFPGVTQGIQVLTHLDNRDLATRFAAVFFETPKLAAAPADCLQLAQLVHDNQKSIDQALTLAPEQLLSLLKQTDALRRPERFGKLLTVCQAIAYAKTAQAAYLPKTFLQALQPYLAQLDLTAITKQNIADVEKAKAITEQRIAAIKTFMETFR